MTAVLDNLYSQENYLLSKKLLDATHLRHEALSNNLANVETPGYKRRDLPETFSIELRRAVDRKDFRRIKLCCQGVLKIGRQSLSEWMETQFS